MQFSGQVPTDRVTMGAELIGTAAIGDFARALEAAAFDAGYVTEHPFPPDSWLRAGGHHALDPFVGLAVAASATQRLRLHTNILVLPYRNPFLTAKAVASLDAVSGGRVILGVAAGYLEPEYRALGADFAHRNELADDALLAIKRANFVPFGSAMNPTTTPDPDAFCEQVVRLAEVGVTWLSVGLPCPSRAAYCEQAARFGEQVIARIRRSASACDPLAGGVSGACGP